MKKKTVSAVFVFLTALYALQANGKKEAKPVQGGLAPPASPYKYSLASGSVGGNFYLLGGGLAQTINNHLGDYFLFTSETTGGSTANIKLLQNGDAELGVVMTSALQEATEGKAEWTGGVKHDKLRGLVPLYPSWLTIYTTRDSGIKTLRDFNGKRVGLGSKGAAMDSIFRQFFKDEGIVPAQIHNDGHGATATALNNGVINVALLFSYPPFAAIAELETSKDLFFVPLNPAEQTALTTKYPFYSKHAIPAGSYKGVTEDVPGVSEWNLLAVSVDVPEREAYLLTKTLFENQADMLAIHPSAKYMTPENCLKFNIPLHAGTVRYLKEIGVSVPEELIPPEYGR
ncbi:MAG: TAXI family TRAP transporter solute-binding subunit [Spirochaetaceae bacterium]|jgi:TRAP transporter TAXI family solute receptor|nr:TAXI family TRAP transporter solute-binding subunit [Spirochaetaceae bacterium]